MILRRLLAWLVAAAALMAGGLAWAQVAVPPFQAFVTDQTGTLKPERQAALESRLRDLQARKGSQLAVLLVPTTQPEPVEQYALRVAEQWKLGRKGVDDGALLLVAKDDRTVRIEVGYGLEGVITDATSKRVISEVLVPHFRQGDFAGGIDEAVTRLIGLVDGEPLPEPKRGAVSQDVGDIGGWLPVLLVGTLVAGGVLRAVLGRVPGALITGGLVGGVAWFLSGLAAIAGVCGVIGFIVTLLGGLGRHAGWIGQGGGHYRGGGWGGGGFGGGGGGFGGGGGGGFGGGGASGKW